MKTKKELAAIEKRIENAFYKTCSGIPVNILAIPKIFEYGRKVVATGATNEELAEKIKHFVKFEL